MRTIFAAGLLLAALVLLSGANVPSALAGGIENHPFAPSLTAEPGVLFDLLGNGSFEQDSGWEFPATPLPAAYSANQARTGLRSGRTGAIKPRQNRYSYSSLRQTVTIPGSATTATLSFFIWQATTETALKQLANKNEYSKPDATLSSDVQYVLVLNASGQRLATVYWNRKNTRSWNPVTFNLLPYKGQPITLQFGTYNDGLDGFTSMYIDDASLYLFTHPGPPSTGLVVNGTFEQDTAWEFPQTPLPAAYATANAYSGNRSARTGALDASMNRYSYSSVRQPITIPANATNVTLYFSFWQWTTESPLTPIPKLPEFNRAERAMAGDVQYALVLNANNQIIGTPYWNRKNTRAWTSFTVDVTQFKGQTIKLQFGTYNDGAGGYTGMYVDDVVMYATTP